MEALNSGIVLRGHLRVVRVSDGAVLVDQDNKLVDAGLTAIVAAMKTAGNINAFKYVGFGTGNVATDHEDTALGTELSGGTYARLVATQDSTALVYTLTGTWTNNSSSNPASVTEYGIFDASEDGTMLARVCVADPDATPDAAKSVATGDKIEITWTVTFADA